MESLPSLKQVRLIGRLFPFLLLAISCKKDDEPVADREPTTEIAIKSINLTGEDRLNSVVRLRWSGSDPDGFIAGYEISYDLQEWFFTTEQDSTFRFVIDAGSDTVNIDFYVRSVDDDGLKDASPAYLKIPLKNTPPEIELNRTLMPTDTAFIVSYMSWSASDLDGFETIDRIELKINDGDWVSMPRNRTFASIIPDNATVSGEVDAQVFYDDGAAGPKIGGLSLNGTNIFYLRAVDIAGSESVADTSDVLTVAGKSNDFLVIGANASSPNDFYKTNLQTAGASYDFIDMMRDGGKNQPKIWTPTFGQLLSFYDQVMIYADASTLTNAQTNADGTFLEFGATSIQSYSDNGGKLVITTSFPNELGISSALFGVLPMDSLSSSEGQARLATDSLAVGKEGFPDLVCSAFIVGLDPIYPSSDAEVLYTAQLTKNGGWEGPDIIAVRRQIGGNTNFIFFSTELHKLNNDAVAMEQLFDKVFNEELNW